MKKFSWRFPEEGLKSLLEEIGRKQHTTTWNTCTMFLLHAKEFPRQPFPKKRDAMVR